MSDSTLTDVRDAARRRDAEAEEVIWAATVASAGLAILPLGTSVVAFIAANTGMIVTLGRLYGFHQTKEQAGQLIRHILTAVGTTWGLGTFAMKLGLEVAKVLGVGTGGAATAVACLVDSVLSGSLSYALGFTAVAYFKRNCSLNDSELREIFRRRLSEGRDKIKNRRTEASGPPASPQELKSWDLLSPRYDVPSARSDVSKGQADSPDLISDRYGAGAACRRLPLRQEPLL